MSFSWIRRQQNFFFISALIFAVVRLPQVNGTKDERSSGQPIGTHFSGRVVEKDQPAVKLVRPASYSEIQAIPIHRFNEEIDDPKISNSGVEEEIIISSAKDTEDETYVSLPLVSNVRAAFSRWTEWSFCSRTCGGGVSMRSRECLDPISYKDECVEHNLFQYMVCNIKPCANSQDDYRAIQCSEFNNTKKFGGIFEDLTWIPFYSSKVQEPCVLNCLAVNSTFYKTFGSARDGTRCSQDKYDMCIGGTCMKVGCDRMLGSTRVEDKCGICGGDNSSCRKVQKLHRDSTDLVKGDYNELMMIPKGATNIKVVESSKNLLALMEARGEYVNYVINGNWLINYPGEIPAAGTLVRYDRKENNETFVIRGRTETDLYIMMLYLGDQPYIEIEYWLGNNQPDNQVHEYRRRYKVVANKEIIRTMPFVDPYSPKTTTINQPTTTVQTTTTQTTTTNSYLQSYRPTQTPKINKVHKMNNNKPEYCRPCKKTVGRKKHFCNSDFVIHVQILSKSRLEGRRYRHDVLLKKVYKSGFKLMRREYIWVYSSCCPRLRRGREYLIMGRKRKIRFGSRGSWITGDSRSKISAGGIQYQTRLVVDYMDYWRTWKTRYDSRMDTYSNLPDKKCEKYQDVTIETTNRDPETSPRKRRRP